MGKNMSDSTIKVSCCLQEDIYRSSSAFCTKLKRDIDNFKSKWENVQARLQNENDREKRNQMIRIHQKNQKWICKRWEPQNLMNTEKLSCKLATVKIPWVHFKTQKKEKKKCIEYVSWIFHQL